MRRRYALTSVIALGSVAVVASVFYVLSFQAVGELAVAAGSAGDTAIAAAILRLRRGVLAVTAAIYVVLAGVGVAAFVPLFRQILDQQERLFDLARTDPLTGSYNRRSFEEVLTREMMRFRRTGRVPTLLLLDIDHFKSINDQHGHQAGDAAIIHFVSTTLGTVRTSDTFGRLGGEEFAVLLPETERDGAMSVAEKVRTAIENATLNRDGKEIRMTVSIGIAVAEQDMAVTDLVAKADEALYLAKSAGRNQSRYIE